MRSRASRLSALAVALAFLVSLHPLAAHELGLTRATLRFTPQGEWQLDVLVDPESLLGRLEILAGRSPSSLVRTDELPARIEALREVARSRVHVRFDGTTAPATVSYIPGPPVPLDAEGSPAQGAATATLRFTGAVPFAAREVRVNYGLVLGSYALTLVGAAGEEQATVWLAGGQDSQPFDLRAGLAAPSTLETAAQYFGLGFTHILPRGLDHILFVVGLFLLSAAWRPLLLQVTLFTIAHSITLGLSMFDVVSLPSALVEPLIALSIAYVAIENLFTTDLKPWRAGLVFLFGLLHGLGFAGVLTELGLPRAQFVTALLTFNLGVEAGQLAVIAGAFLTVGWWRRTQSAAYRRWVVVPASLAIAIVGVYWTVVRLP